MRLETVGLPQKNGLECHKRIVIFGARKLEHAPCAARKPLSFETTTIQQEKYEATSVVDATRDLGSSVTLLTAFVGH